MKWVTTPPLLPSCSEGQITATLSNDGMHNFVCLIQNCIFLICYCFLTAANDTIDHLDLSWNHLRNKGACAVALSLKVCSSGCYMHLQCILDFFFFFFTNVFNLKVRIRSQLFCLKFKTLFK